MRESIPVQWRFPPGVGLPSKAHFGLKITADAGPVRPTRRSPLMLNSKWAGSLYNQKVIFTSPKAAF